MAASLRAMSSLFTYHEPMAGRAPGVMFAKMWQWMRGGFGLFSLRRPTQEEIQAAARAMLGACAVCGESLVGHDLALVGSAITSEGSTAPARLREAVAARDWRSAAALQEWQGDADELEFKVLRCPWNPEKLELLTIQSYAALELKDRVVGRQLLTESETRSLMDAVGLEWWTL